MALPNYVVAFIVFAILILISFGFKLIFMRKLGTQTPEKMRKQGIKAVDGHVSWTLYEHYIEIWLKSQGVPHEKPESAEIGEYYSNSRAVPYFVIYTSPKKIKVDSMIDIKGIDRPSKFQSVIRTPELKTTYPECLISYSELESGEWKTHLYTFYKDLRKRNRKQSKNGNEENAEFNNSAES